MLSAPELVGCWPLGAIIDPNGDNDETLDNMLDEGEQDLEEED